MKDLDFDELDRAVSSLMSKTPDTGSQSAPAAPAAPTPAVTSEEATPITVTNNSKPPVPEVAAPAPLAQKRSGRFMDMVPGSRQAPAAPRVASREGMTISPTGSAPATPDTPSEASSTESVAVSVEPTTPVAGAEAAPAKTDWPDPLAVAAGSSENEAADNQDSSIPSEPLGSPFLTDAKVEKRPLNSGSMDTEKQELAEDSDEPLVPSRDDKDEPPEDPPIPAELNSDLIAIESDQLKTHPETPEEAKETEEKAPAEVPQADEKSTGPTSIVQQYKEQPSSEDHSHAAIYDSSHFPEPLAHPAKKSSGWLWVLWVLLLLAVGAGGAVALYSLGIIT